MTVRLAVVVSGFPRTSETFALGELTALARAGMLARIYATKPGDGAARQPGVAELMPLLRVLPALDPAGQADALVADLADLADLDRLAGQDGTPVVGIHGYFGHTPAEVAELAATRLGVAFSMSLHALDARKVEPLELARRACAAAGVVVCNADVAEHVGVPGARVAQLPHGVDLTRFGPRPGPAPDADGALRVLAVGRFVEKKGFATLVDALARLDVPWRLRMVGTGPLKDRVREQLARHDVDRAGTAARVELVGRRTHEELPAEYAWSDVVAVPSVVDSRGDRDGLPNVALEAMASGRALVVSDVSALGPTVRAAGSGIVVPPHDVAALAGALATLTDPALRAALGGAGRRHVEAHFDLARCGTTFAEHLAALHHHAPETADA